MKIWDSVYKCYSSIKYKVLTRYSTQYLTRARVTRPQSINFTIRLGLNLGHRLLVFASTTNLKSRPRFANICFEAFFIVSNFSRLNNLIKSLGSPFEQIWSRRFTADRSKIIQMSERSDHIVTYFITNIDNSNDTVIHLENWSHENRKGLNLVL